MDDVVVRLRYDALVSWIRPPAVAPRKRNRMSSSPRDAAADFASATRSTSPAVGSGEVNGEGDGAGEATANGVVGAEEV